MKVLLEIIVKDQDKEYTLPLESKTFANDLLQLLQKYGFNAELVETGNEVQ